jgi:hypothetical protein
MRNIVNLVVRDSNQSAKLEAKLETLEQKVGEMDKKYIKIINKLDFICRKLERGRSISTRTRGQMECFTCKGPNLQRYCPENKMNAEKQPKPEKTKFILWQKRGREKR